MTIAAKLIDIRKDYVLKGETVRALRGVSFEIPAGDYVAIMGPSGSGKSTLLNLLGCLDKPTAGQFFLGGDDVARMTDDQLSYIRATRIGFVFQSYNLIQQYTVLENIEVPLLYQGRLSAKGRRRCRELAEMVGLGDRLGHRPTQLSGGQQQRVAIARSLVNDPYFILADEATGNLDSVTSEEILAMFERLNDEGRTIIMVTHEDDVAAHAKRIIRLRDGLLQSDRPNERRIRARARVQVPGAALPVEGGPAQEARAGVEAA
jgi:putative ABC transport system ATP-binding protein